MNQLLFFIIVSFFGSTAGNANGLEKELLLKGLEYEGQGKYELALLEWEAAFTKLENPSFTIAREYIRVATEQDLHSYYRTASSLYFWGLSAEYGELNIDAFKNELGYLSPLFTKQEFTEITKIADAQPLELAKTISSFWVNLDLTPGTAYNERLLEHWERIAYARKSFNRNDNTVYETDDRGIEYIRFGSPNRKHVGKLLVSTSDVDEMCNTLSAIEASRCSSSQFLATILQKEEPVPEYEIWIYDRLNKEMSNNLVLLFGETAIRDFRRVELIEDFIPDNLFSMSNKRWDTPSQSIGTLSPGMALQYIYYKKLSTKDMLFGKTFSRMEREWRPNNPVTGNNQGIVLEQQTSIEVRTDFKKAPSEVTNLINESTEIPIEVHFYQLLDENNLPYSVAFLASQPFQAFIYDITLNDEVMMPTETSTFEDAFNDYKLFHGLSIQNEEGEILANTKLPTPLDISEKGKNPSYSVFKVPSLNEGKEVIFYAELHNNNPETKPFKDSPFTASLRGIGKTNPQFPNPIKVNTTELILGDLIFGYAMDYSEDEGVLFPFVVSHSLEIPKGEALALHIEVYNLNVSDKDIGNLNLEYKVTKERNLDWLRGREEEVKLSVGFQTNSDRFVENLEIQTRELEAGSYTLTIVVSDMNSGQKVEKELEFKIID